MTGSGTQNIVVQQPDALTTIESPLTITGLARAFEGKVDVELRADDNDQPLFQGVVIGGSGSELEPYEETFEFDSPASRRRHAGTDDVQPRQRQRARG